MWRIGIILRKLMPYGHPGSILAAAHRQRVTNSIGITLTNLMPYGHSVTILHCWRPSPRVRRVEIRYSSHKFDAGWAGSFNFGRSPQTTIQKQQPTNNVPQTVIYEAQVKKSNHKLRPTNNEPQYINRNRNTKTAASTHKPQPQHINRNRNT